MPEEIKAGQAEEQVTPESKQAKPEIDIDEITKRIMADVETRYKNEISGLNRKVSESEKALKAKLSDEERIKLEQEEERKTFLSDFSALAAEKIGLGSEFSSLINGSNKDEIKSKIDILDKFKQSIEAEHLKTIKKLEDELKIYKTNTEPPKAGSPTAKSGLQDQYNELKKSGKTAEMIAVIRAAQREGINIIQ